MRSRFFVIDFRFIIGSLCLVDEYDESYFIVLGVPPNFRSHCGSKTVFMVIGLSLGVKHMHFMHLCTYHLYTLFTLLARVPMCDPIIPFVMGVGWRCHFSLVLFRVRIF